MILFEVGHRHKLRSLCWVSVCSALLGLILSSSIESASEFYRHPEIGVSYIVDVADEQVRFDISLDDESDLFLVVSSLGEYQQEYSIECSVKRIVEPLLGSFTPLIPLDVKPNSRLGGSLALPGFSRDEVSDIHSVPISWEHDRVLEKEFHLHVTDGDLWDSKQYACVKGVIVGEGKYVRVYLDSQENRDNIARNLVEEITRIFDKEIVPRSQSLYGRCRDIDDDGKFTILLSPWLSRLGGGKVSIGGFVRSSDFQK